MKIMSSREFNQDVSQAKRVARREPVFVTDRGKPTHVLMSIDAFRQIVRHRIRIGCALFGYRHGVPSR